MTKGQIRAVQPRGACHIGCVGSTSGNTVIPPRMGAGNRSQRRGSSEGNGIWARARVKVTLHRPHATHGPWVEQPWCRLQIAHSMRPKHWNNASISNRITMKNKDAKAARNWKMTTKQKQIQRLEVFKLGDQIILVPKPVNKHVTCWSKRIFSTNRYGCGWYCATGEERNIFRRKKNYLDSYRHIRLACYSMLSFKKQIY